MQALYQSITEFIELHPILLSLRNLVLFGIVVAALYLFIFSRHGGGLREKLPFLRNLGMHRQAKRLISKGEYAQAGELYLTAGMFKEAVQTFTDGQLYGRAADVYLAKNQKQRAAALYEKAGQFEKAASLYLEKRDFEKAEENLSKIGKEEQLAALYEQQGSKSLAAGSYLKLGRIQDALRIYVELKDFKTAADILRKLYNDANTSFDEATGFKSRQELVKRCGELYIEAELYDEAAALFIAEELFKEAGEAYAKAKQFEKAIEYFNKGDHFFAAAEIYYQLGQHQQAASVEAEGFIREGNEAQAAQCYIKAGDYAAAGDVYRNMVEHQKAGEMYEKAKEYALAGNMFSKVDEYERAGLCFEKAKKYDEAIDYYGRAENYARQVALMEKQEKFYLAAHNYYQRGLFDEARSMIEKVPADHEDFKKATALAGKMLLEEGNLSAAKQKLEEAVSSVKEISSDNIGAIYDLARVSEKLGEDSRALYTIEKMLAEDLLQGSEDPLEDMKKKIGTMLTKVGRSSSVMQYPEFAESGELKVTKESTSAETAKGEQRYLPIKEIGKGGMGIVYKARDSVLDRVIALKVLPANLKQSKQAVATFTREGKSAASLNHANIVIVHDAGIQDGDYYIAMELIDGMTIKDIIKKNKRLSLRSVYAVTKQLLAGLEYAHERKVVHRDLTTNNLMWNRNKQLKIMDFGLAKVVRELQSEQSIIGGTPSYMSPEQTLGNPIDHRTDIYSLGICLFEMCTGVLPFRKGNLGYHHVHTEPPDPKSRNPALPDSLCQLILKCLKKDPAQRPQSVEEVRQWLAKDPEFEAA